MLCVMSAGQLSSNVLITIETIDMNMCQIAWYNLVNHPIGCTVTFEFNNKCELRSIVFYHQLYSIISSTRLLRQYKLQF